MGYAGMERRGINVWLGCNLELFDLDCMEICYCLCSCFDFSSELYNRGVNCEDKEMNGG